MSASEEVRTPDLPEIEVVRLGGSLLLPEVTSSQSQISLRSRLAAWSGDRPGLRVWIVGTGAWGNRLRRVQAPLGLSDEACHWAAIELMSVAGAIAATLLGGSELVRSLDDLRYAIEGRTKLADVVFDSTQFLRTFEPTMPGRALPRDWSVTSDSIAARVASAIDADALTLVKACAAPARLDPQAWSEQGLVDAFFPQVELGRTELRWVDLSCDPPAERRYRPE